MRYCSLNYLKRIRTTLESMPTRSSYGVYAIPPQAAEPHTKRQQHCFASIYAQFSYWSCIWESFIKYHYVLPSEPTAKLENRATYYKGEPSLPIEIGMGKSGLKPDGAELEAWMYELIWMR